MAEDTNVGGVKDKGINTEVTMDHIYLSVVITHQGYASLGENAVDKLEQCDVGNKCEKQMGCSPSMLNVV